MIGVQVFSPNSPDSARPISFPNYSDPKVANWSRTRDAFSFTPEIFQTAVKGTYIGHIDDLKTLKRPGYLMVVRTIDSDSPSLSKSQKTVIDCQKRFQYVKKAWQCIEVDIQTMSEYITTLYFIISTMNINTLAIFQPRNIFFNGFICLRRQNTTCFQLAEFIAGNYNRIPAHLMIASGNHFDEGLTFETSHLLFPVTAFHYLGQILIDSQFSNHSKFLTRSWVLHECQGISRRHPYCSYQG